MRWIATTLAGILLLPACAGLGITLFELLVGIQSEAEASRSLSFFLAGLGLWIVVFLFLTRPVRLYILSHELSHLLVAWASGIGGGNLQVHQHGGSVNVERSTFWVALAPYFLPLYSLLVLIVFSVLGPRISSIHLIRTLPFLLGVTWSFHLTFTIYALSRPQSDLRSYGAPGSIAVLLFINLLLLAVGAAVRNPSPFQEELLQGADNLMRCYLWSWDQIFLIKNTIFQS